MLCAVVLAAGAGTRLRPLTDLRPKALCPVGNVTLLDRTLDRLAALGFSGPSVVAVNAHRHASQIVAAVGERAHLSVESPEALGTAGAIARLRDWIAGRDVLVCNADAYLAGGDVEPLLRGWSGGAPRLLAVRAPDRDFVDRRFAGMSLLPWATAASLRAEPTGLYEVVWRAAHARGELEFAYYDGTFIDCGRPADYLAANLHATGGGNIVDPSATVTGAVKQGVVGAGATVAGDVCRAVVWPDAVVHAGEVLSDAVRVGTDLTVPAGPDD